MIEVLIDEETLLDMLDSRLNHYWNPDEEVADLFHKMWKLNIDRGAFTGIEFDVKTIVDNDYINWCSVVREDDERFEELLKSYKDNEYDVAEIGHIEAVDDEDEPTMFLIRC